MDDLKNEVEAYKKRTGVCHSNDNDDKPNSTVA